MFRAFFGGDTYAHDTYVSQEQVFKVLDVLYGVSKVYDYRPGSEWMEVSLKIGNSINYDVKRTQMLVESIAVLPPHVSQADKDKKWDNNNGEPSKVIGIVQFTNLVRKAPDLIRRIFAVQDYTREICGGVSMWRHAAKNRAINHEALDDMIESISSEQPDLFRHGLNIRSRTAFSNAEVLRVRRESFSFSQEYSSSSREYSSSTKERGGKSGGSSAYAVREKPIGHASSLYHRLDFGTADGNGRFTAIKRRKSYVANAGDSDYTGPVNAEKYHQAAAVVLQKRGRGMAGRIKAKQRTEIEGARLRAKQRKEAALLQKTKT